MVSCCVGTKLSVCFAATFRKKCEQPLPPKAHVILPRTQPVKNKKAINKTLSFCRCSAKSDTFSLFAVLTGGVQLGTCEKYWKACHVFCKTQLSASLHDDQLKDGALTRCLGLRWIEVWVRDGWDAHCALRTQIPPFVSKAARHGKGATHLQSTKIFWSFLNISSKQAM